MTSVRTPESVGAPHYARDMGWWSEQVVPRITDVALSRAPVAALRRQVLAEASGTVVELGFGSGTNLPYYPPAVREVVGVEPSPLARRLATERIAAAPVGVRFVGLDAAALPLEADVADTVVSTFTLCTVPDLPRTLAEVRRVLRPGGRFLLLEHGLAPEPATARRQRLLDPVQQRLFAGCHLTRDTGAAVRAAGFTIDRLTHARLPGPGALSYLSVVSAG